MPEQAGGGGEGRRVLLIGMMGTGKSSIGRALARRTGWQFVDNDELLEQATGRTARELLAASGEAALRRGESAALHRGLEADPPVILGVAAGVVLDDPDRARLDGAGFVVWLHASPEVLADRAVGAAHRPWLEGDALGWFRRVGTDREPLYAEVADLRIDTGTTTPESAADAILAALEISAGAGRARG